MSIKSSTVTVTTTPVLLATGTPGSGNVKKQVVLAPAGAVFVGGIDDQTFPIDETTNPPLQLNLVGGDDVWAVSAGSVDVEVLEVSI